MSQRFVACRKAFYNFSFVKAQVFATCKRLNKNSLSLFAIATTVIFAFALGSCQKKPVGSGTAKVGPVLPLTTYPTYLEVMQQNSSLSRSLAYFKLCELETELNKGTIKTIWMPTDDGWKKHFGSGTPPTQCNDSFKLLLKHHLATELHGREGLFNGMALETLATEKVFVSTSLKSPINTTSVSEDTIGTSDLDMRTRYLGEEIFTSTGVAHVLDTVLTPDSLGRLDAAVEKRPFLTESVRLIKQSGQEAEARKRDGVTVILPTNIGLSQFDSTSNSQIFMRHVLSSAMKLRGFARYPTKVLSLEKSTLLIEQDDVGDFFISLAEMASSEGSFKARILESVTTVNGQLEVVDMVIAPSE